MGYIGSKMSIRAHFAHEDDKHPLSYWNKDNIIDELCGIYNDSDIERLSKYTKKVLQAYFLECSEWHHTGAYYTRTDFYSIRKLEKIDYEYLDTLKVRCKDAHNKRIKAKKVFFRYGIWEGTRKHPKLVNHEGLGLLCDDWIYYQGGKKNVNGKHVDILEVYERAPRGTSTIFKEIEKNLPMSIKKKIKGGY